MPLHKKRYSHDSACDESTLDTKFNNQRRDDESIYSSHSTTSSMFSTASRMSKIPNAVKSSVKYLVRRKNKAVHNETTTTTTESETLSSKIKRHTSSSINFSNLFNSSSRNNNHSKRQTEQDIIPTTTTSSTLFGYKQTDNNSINNNKAKRRNSVVNLASRFLYKRDQSTISTTTLGDQDEEEEEYEQQQHSIIVYEDQLESGIFVHHESDSKSEKVIKPKKEEPWVRQRAKSCQENKAPLLHQLANKGSSNRLIVDLPENDSIPYKSNNKMMANDFPLFKGLVTTTLTTLHTRLTNECDRVLSIILLADHHTAPQEQLLSIISDLYKMTEMVNWENQDDKKKETKTSISLIENAVLNQDLTIISVKDFISSIKQIMNQCICQYYKVVEKAMIIPSKGYKIEGINKYGNNNSILSQIPKSQINQNYTVDHMDKEAHWYRTYFFDSTHVYTFFGYQEDGDPILLSVKVEQNNETITNRQFRIIFRTKKGKDQRRVILDSFLLNCPPTTTNAEEYDIIPETTWKSLVETNFNIPFHNLILMNQDLMISSGIQDELLRLDENSLHTRYKFGVLLIKEGQTREEEWFSNDHDSEPFNQFLNIIGNPVKLKGYTGWAAGLDTKSGDSGDYTYTNVWNENILAYHVSTLIPSRPGDKQQIQRKRHIGNDIVCIVFVEGNQPFNPTAIKSQFLHVFIVVHQEVSNKAKLWRVEIVSVKDVPDFGPSLPENSAVFYNEKELEQFLLAKCKYYFYFFRKECPLNLSDKLVVNAEYAAFKSPKFASPMNRAREGIFTNLVEKGWKLLFNDSNISSSSTANNTTNISLLNNNNNNNTNNNISTSTTTTTTTTTSSSPTRKLLFHTKSASTSSSSQSSSQHNSVIPSPSKSNVIREFSEGIVNGISRRRSTQDLLNSNNTNTNFKKTSGVRGRKFTEGSSKRSHSEQDLIKMTLEHDSIVKTSLKNRAQNLLTSIPGFGNHS
ncbi:hypothetical protein HPULCUR_000186 [Helicostylum pulchrum]|uniref:Rap-GAP domain-containing protein n=1 Tax=Helicostylum pulchrum TaxID=562976 RepID=A0ABP9XK67_9FUNG